MTPWWHERWMGIISSPLIQRREKIIDVVFPGAVLPDLWEFVLSFIKKTKQTRNLDSVTISLSKWNILKLTHTAFPCKSSEREIISAWNACHRNSRKHYHKRFFGWRNFLFCGFARFICLKRTEFIRCRWAQKSKEKTSGQLF